MSGEVARHLADVRERITRAAHRVGRGPESVSLVAATKGVDVARIQEAIAAGQGLFGENRVQEALPKILGCGAGTWHLVGRLQTNKVKQVVGVFELIHSVDSLRLAREVEQVAAGRLRQRILVQVNVSGETTKAGVSPAELLPLLKELALCEHVAVQGLMTIPPLAPDPEASRAPYRCLAELAERARQEGFPVQELSMGMSGDFEVAIEEGATLVRVGTAIFGARVASPRIG